MESSHPNAITSKDGSKIHLAEAGATSAVILSVLDNKHVASILATAPMNCWAKHSIDAFLSDIAQAREEGISRAYGKYNPSIYAVAVPLKVSPYNAGALAVVEWPEDFDIPKNVAVESTTQKVCPPYSDVDQI